MQKNLLSCHHCDKAISDWVLNNCRRSRKHFSLFIFQFLREEFELTAPKVMHLCNSGTHSIYYRWLSFGLVSWQPIGLLCCTAGCAGMQLCRFSNSCFVYSYTLNISHNDVVAHGMCTVQLIGYSCAILVWNKARINERMGDKAVLPFLH